MERLTTPHIHSQETRTTVMVSALTLSLVLVVVAGAAPVVGVFAAPLGGLLLLFLSRRAEPQERAVFLLAAQIAAVATVIAVVVGAFVLLR